MIFEEFYFDGPPGYSAVVTVAHFDGAEMDALDKLCDGLKHGPRWLCEEQDDGSKVFVALHWNPRRGTKTDQDDDQGDDDDSDDDQDDDDGPDVNPVSITSSRFKLN